MNLERDCFVHGAVWNAVVRSVEYLGADKCAGSGDCGWSVSQLDDICDRLGCGGREFFRL